MIKVLRFLGIPDDRVGMVIFNLPGQIEIKFNGNAEIIHTLPLNPNLFQVETLLLPFILKNHSKNLNLDFTIETNLIFNEICNPDVCKMALNLAVKILEFNPQIPVINHPKLVLETSRDKLYQKLQSIENLLVPKTIRIKPSSLADIKEEVEKEDMYPFIFRKVGYHTLWEAPLIRNKEDLKLLEVFPFMGEEYYLTKFIDYRSGDGLYRKYRVLVIKGELYPRHLIVSDYWNIHAKDRERIMDHQEKYRREEKEWFEDFTKTSYGPLLEVYERLKLDFFAVDFGIFKDGTLLFFEASPCCKYIIGTIKDLKQEYAYHVPYIKKIEEAFVNLIRTKAKVIKLRER